MQQYSNQVSQVRYLKNTKSGDPRQFVTILEEECSYIYAWRQVHQVLGAQDKSPELLKNESSPPHRRLREGVP